jgi:mRNA interferase HigB
MRVISLRPLREFWEAHADAEGALRAWFKDAEESQWKSPADITQVYATASILPDNRVVFNIRGNTYRLIVKINYSYSMVYVRFVGTHAEYDRVDATEI